MDKKIQMKYDAQTPKSRKQLPEEKKFKKREEDFVEKIREARRIRTQFVVLSKEIKESKNKNQYIETKLKDKTGWIVGRIFPDDLQKTFDSIMVGKVHRVIANVNEFPMGSGKFSMMMNVIKEVPEAQYDREDFVLTSELNIEEGIRYLHDIIKTVEDHHLKKLLKGFFEDEEFMKKFTTAPAARIYHHNYEGGLLEHTLEVTEICDFMCNQHKDLQRNVLITGALLHDIGKIRSYEWDFMNIERSTEGKLIEHTILGCMMVERKAEEIKFNGNLEEVIHLVASHNGEIRKGWGSSVDPQTPEAIALHQADNLNAKVKTALQGER